MLEINKLKEKFDKQIDILKKLNPQFEGEVLLKSGVLIIGAFDKYSASVIRAAFKKARNVNGGTLTEVRGKEGASFVWVSDKLLLSKKEVRKLALAA